MGSAQTLPLPEIYWEALKKMNCEVLVALDVRVTKRLIMREKVLERHLAKTTAATSEVEKLASLLTDIKRAKRRHEHVDVRSTTRPTRDEGCDHAEPDGVRLVARGPSVCADWRS